MTGYTKGLGSWNSSFKASKGKGGGVEIRSIGSFRVVGMVLVLATIGAGLVLGPLALVRDSRTQPFRPQQGIIPQAVAQNGAPDISDSPTGGGELLLVPAAPPEPVALKTVGVAAAPRSGSVDTLGAEQKLASLSYLVGAVDGVFDQATAFGFTAFQKIEGLPRTGQADPETLSRLNSAARPLPAYSTPPSHIEVDIARQVVLVVSGGQVTATLPTSTGSGKFFTSQGRRRQAVTPNGQFAVSSKISGWRHSPLGYLYRPSYIYGGIAIHGAKSVPNYPASHGCIRLPMPFADWFADQASPIGTVVYVYGNSGDANPAATNGAPVRAGPTYTPDGSYNYVPPTAPEPPTSGNGGAGGGVLSGLLGG